MDMNRKKFIMDLLGTVAAVTIGSKLEWASIPVKEEAIPRLLAQPGTDARLLRIFIPKGIFHPNDIIRSSEGREFYLAGTNEPGVFKAKDIHNPGFEMLMIEHDTAAPPNMLRMCSAYVENS